MPVSLIDRFKNSWNAFFSREPTVIIREDGYGYGRRPDRPSFSRGNKHSIVASIYNKIAVDTAAININHARVDETGKYLYTIDSGLNDCLTKEANIDQTGRDFIQDVVISMLDEGVVAIVPVDADSDPRSGSFDILSVRTGKIINWYPEKVRIRLYNDRKGIYEEIIMPKRSVAICTNPFYAIMNEPNSTLQRLIHKINLLDRLDEKSASGKLDMIVQLPYTIRSEQRRKEAERRRNEIDEQINGSAHGIAYTDGTEKIIQLNRPLENNLLEQIKDLRTTLYNQLGLSESVFDGTADDAAMLNYYNRVIEPIMSTIADNMMRAFLTRTARTQGQAITFNRDPFRLVPVEKLADIADRLTRNEVLSSNEVRGIIGYKPVDDTRADELRNKNIAEASGSGMAPDVNTINTEPLPYNDYGYYDPIQDL